ncbi:MAG: hypothetical protein H6726_07965 [Sandaracinaceae bacterium]|nr:hypothetical protein [Myxococcales bacterium]MCB9657565.1 hypothetical protein [Sandaracinaceae bacterium]
MSNTAPPTSTRSPQAQAAIDIIANRFATREQARSAELDALEAGATPEEAVRAFVDVMHGASPPAQRVYMEQAFEMLDVSPESFLALLQAQVRAEDEKVMTATNTIQNALQSSRELSERMQALQILHQRVSQDSDQSVDLQDGDITVNGRQMCLGQAVIEFDLVDELNLTRHVDGDPLWYRGVALRADAIQSAIDGLRQKQQSVTSSNELNMINMQQAMQQRGQHIQLVSKVLAMMGDTERAIVGNMR